MVIFFENYGKAQIKVSVPYLNTGYVCKSNSSPDIITLTAYGGTYNEESPDESKRFPFEVIFTAPSNAPSNYVWEIRSTSLGTFPNFLALEDNTTISHGSTYNNSPLLIKVNPNPTLPPPQGRFEFQVLMTGGLDKIVVLDFLGGCPGGGCADDFGPNIAFYSNICGETKNLKSQFISTGQSFKEDTIAAIINGGSGTYIWEILDEDGNPLDVNPSNPLAYGIIDPPSGEPLSRYTGSKKFITLGNSRTNPLQNSFSYSVRVRDTDERQNLSLTTSVAELQVDGAAGAYPNTALVKVLPGNSSPGSSGSIATVTFPDPTPKYNLVNDWFDEVFPSPSKSPTIFEYNQTVQLNHPISHYLEENDPIKSISEELLRSSLSLANDLFVQREGYIENVIFYIKDESNQLTYWATQERESILTSEGRKLLGISLINAKSNWDVMAYTLGHNLGMIGLHYYPNSRFLGRNERSGANLLPIRWDHMAVDETGVFSGVHPTYYSKYLANAIPYSDKGLEGVEYIPYTSTPTRLTTDLFFQSTKGPITETKAIVVDLTPENNGISTSNRSLWIEARGKNLNNADKNIPNEGILVYQVNKGVRQGAGPVQLFNFADEQNGITKPIPPNTNVSDLNGTGLDINVGPNSGNSYNINLVYSPPTEVYDLYLREAGETSRLRTVWITTQAEDPCDQDYFNTPIRGEKNEIWARVYNNGPGTSKSALVKFFLSENSMTVNDEKIFDDALVENIPPGRFQDVHVEWVPKENLPANISIRVEVHDLGNSDQDRTNNIVETDFIIENTWPGSPYTTRKYNFSLTNPDTISRYVILKPYGIPPNWEYSIESEDSSFTFSPGQKKTITFNYLPPENYDTCINHLIRLEAFTPDEHLISKVGEIFLDIQTKSNTVLKLEQEIIDCEYESDYYSSFKNLGDGCGCENSINVTYDQAGYNRVLNHIFGTLSTYYETNNSKRGCNVIKSKGKTIPARAYQTILMRYKDPAGNPIYKRLQTDEKGFFSDQFVATNGGEWEVSAIFEGTSCARRVDITKSIILNITQNTDQDFDGLPDIEEVQGDHDGDGIPNHLDRDSDNDGIIDGKEEKQDCDNDNYTNVVDVDSDNDGIPDGIDIEICNPNTLDDFVNVGNNNIKLPFGFGRTRPVGSFDDVYDSNYYVEIKSTIKIADLAQINDKALELRLNLEGGLYTFNDSLASPLNIWSYAGGLRLEYPLISLGSLGNRNISIYVDGNYGRYLPSDQDWKEGWNYGFGGSVNFGNFFVDFGYSRFDIQDDIKFDGLGLAIGFGLQNNPLLKKNLLTKNP